MRGAGSGSFPRLRQAGHDVFVPGPGGLGELGHLLSPEIDLQAPRFRDLFQRLAELEGDGWRIPAIEPGEESLGLSDEKDAEWVRSKMTPHPIRTLLAPANLGNPAAEKIPRTDIFCTANPPDGTLRRIAGEIEQDPAWKYLELSAPHAAMITAANQLAATILQALQ